MEASNLTYSGGNKHVVIARPPCSLGSYQRNKAVPQYSSYTHFVQPMRVGCVPCSVTAGSESCTEDTLEAIDPCEHSTSSVECSGSYTSASLSRAVGLLKPSSTTQVMRLVRQRAVTNPASILPIIIVSILSLTMAAARTSTIQRVRACTDCKGYGIERCPVCGGTGVMSWEGKYFHKDEPCPRCLGTRYTKCRTCGGDHHRPIFEHTTKQW